MDVTNKTRQKNKSQIESATAGIVAVMALRLFKSAVYLQVVASVACQLACNTEVVME